MTFLGSNDPITCIGTYIKPNITIIHYIFTVISIYIKLEAVRYTEMSVCPISPGLFATLRCADVQFPLDCSLH